MNFIICWPGYNKTKTCYVESFSDLRPRGTPFDASAPMPTIGITFDRDKAFTFKNKAEAVKILSDDGIRCRPDVKIEVK